MICVEHTHQAKARPRPESHTYASQKPKMHLVYSHVVFFKYSHVYFWQVECIIHALNVPLVHLEMSPFSIARPHAECHSSLLRCQPSCAHSHHTSASYAGSRISRTFLTVIASFMVLTHFPHRRPTCEDRMICTVIPRSTLSVHFTLIVRLYAAMKFNLLLSRIARRCVLRR